MSELRKFLIDFLKILADSTRLEILDLLRNGDKTSRKIQKELNKSQSTISQHLKLLINNNLIISEKKRNLNHYKIKNQDIFKLISSISEFANKINKEKLKELRDLDVLDTLS